MLLSRSIIYNHTVCVWTVVNGHHQVKLLCVESEDVPSGPSGPYPTVGLSSGQGLQLMEIQRHILGETESPAIQRNNFEVEVF